MNSRKYIVSIFLILTILVAGSTSAFAIQDSKTKTPKVKSEKVAKPAKPSKTEKTEKVEKPAKSPKPATAPVKKSSSNSSINYGGFVIKNIEITGANIIRSEYILDKMHLQAGAEYDRDLMQEDLKRIYQMGFFTDKLKAIPVENPDHSITLKIIVEENLPITDFTIEGNTVVSNEELLSYLMPLKGKPQNVLQINQAIENIQNCYFSKGYILARISEFYDDPDGVINLKISEGVINKISFTGNKKTKDFVIERNILTEPGMVYNENLLKADLVRLYATQVFKDVNREIEPSDEDPEKYDITIEVKEARSATIAIGGGIDSATGLFGSVGINDTNFRGRNERLGVSFLAGTGVIMSDASVQNHANLQAELNFFEPYLLSADNSLAAKIYFRDFGSYQVPLAIEQRLGGDITFAHRISTNKNLTSTFGLGIENVDVREGNWDSIQRMYKKIGIPKNEMRDLRNEQLEGGLFLSFTPGLMYDSRDSAMNPRNGYIASAKFSENLGLDSINKTHGKLMGSVKRYFPVMSKSAFSLTGKAGGVIHGRDHLPDVMAYRLGGPYSIRGFKIGTVGTGNAFLMGSAELNTPLLFLDRIKKVSFFDNLKLSFFVDAGKVLDANSLTNAMYDRPLSAITAGVGVKVYIPGLGPLSVDYGIPITNPRGGSRSGYVTFGIGDVMY